MQISITKGRLLLIAAFLIATSGLAFELIAGAISSYLLGDYVTQFSLTIGLYLFAMGIGSYLAQFIVGSQKKLILKFIQLEIALSLIGGTSALTLFISYSLTSWFEVYLWSILIVIGTIVGIEIPLLLRILKDKFKFKKLVSNVLALDYLGGLFVGIAFPIIFVPQLGFIKSSLVFGAMNLCVAFLALLIYKDVLPIRRYLVYIGLTFLILLGCLLNSEKLFRWQEKQLYADRIVLATQSKYQRIVITKWGDQFSLFLNRNLQFNSKDEYRYHEALVHPLIMTLNQQNKFENINVLVMGGGDGLAIREILKYNNITRIDLVDLDPEMTRLAKENPWLSKLNNKALSSDKVKIFNQDAFLFANQLKSLKEKYHAIILDFPDPNNYSLGKLYSTTFYYRLRSLLHKDGFAITQATSPLFARKSFWCINKTIRSTGFKTTPMHVYVPSFGEWGFILFSKKSRVLSFDSNLKDLQYLNKESFSQLFKFPIDMKETETQIQSLDNQKLVQYYHKEWNSIVK